MPIRKVQPELNTMLTDEEPSFMQPRRRFDSSPEGGLGPGPRVTSHQAKSFMDRQTNAIKEAQRRAIERIAKERQALVAKRMV
eukprot:TRINITY_DN3893_c0_g1_i1.p2 TRINITY_DN3893_c0_g1~~TRINITY_DN3893_c0_g1_i1.p2  ORF type:complete len:96 (-),score=27.01 TRINITY_DN3893_c0_g1_i1:16-264(-)